MGRNQLIASAVFYAALSLPTTAHAINSDQQQAIERLGELNGIALHCGYFEETTRLKEAMVAHVPKVRALGALFEETTQASFMSVVKQSNACPNAQKLATDVNEGITTLRRAFAQQ